MKKIVYFCILKTYKTYKLMNDESMRPASCNRLSNRKNG